MMFNVLKIYLVVLIVPLATWFIVTMTVIMTIMTMIMTTMIVSMTIMIHILAMICGTGPMNDPPEQKRQRLTQRIGSEQYCLYW